MSADRARAIRSDFIGLGGSAPASPWIEKLHGSGSTSQRHDYSKLRANYEAVYGTEWRELVIQGTDVPLDEVAHR